MHDTLLRVQYFSAFHYIIDWQYMSMDLQISPVQCAEAVANDVDIINFSYGEASHWTNKG